MPQTHYLAVSGSGGHLKHLRNRSRIHSQRMVAGEVTGIWKVPKNPRTVHLDGLHLSVNDIPGLNDIPAVSLGQTLMTQAHPENGNLPGKSFDGLNRNTRIRGSTGPGRNNQPPGVQLLKLCHCNLVVPEHLHLFIRVVRDKLTDHLINIVCKRIVVVDYCNESLITHPQTSTPAARARALSFSLVSSSSRSGLESYTTPPPA